MQQACLWKKTNGWECVCEGGIAKHLYVLPFLSNTSRAVRCIVSVSLLSPCFGSCAQQKPGRFCCRGERALLGSSARESSETHPGSCSPEHGGALRTGSWTRCISASAAQRFRQTKRRHRTGRLNAELWKTCIISRLFQSARKQQRPVCKCQDFHS